MEKIFRFTTFYEDGNTMEILYRNKDNNKTQSDFKNDIKFLINKYGIEYLDQLTKIKFASGRNWCEFALSHIEELVYEKIDFIDFSIYDDIMIRNNDDEYLKDEENFKSYADKNLIYSAIKHNNYLDNDFDF